MKADKRSKQLAEKISNNIFQNQTKNHALFSYSYVANYMGFFAWNGFLVPVSSAGFTEFSMSISLGIFH